MGEVNTLFLRLEGSMQAWGTQESKFVIRRAGEAPTKSGIIGLIFATMGISREEADANECKILKDFANLKIGIRIDRPGFRWWDYHTVGAKIGNLTAKGIVKKTASTGEIETLLSRREYLCDASFLVAIMDMGDKDLISDIEKSLLNPVWTPYLGRKCCPPSVPIFKEADHGNFDNLITALRSKPYRPRYKNEEKPDFIEYLVDWNNSDNDSIAPIDAEIWYDVPDSFVWPSHHPRFVIRGKFNVGEEIVIGEETQNHTPAPQRPRADYTNSEFRKRRKERLDLDNHLCVFCKSTATTVQHITYRNAGGNEKIEELKALCRLCHDAITMLEYGENMGIDRIDPENPEWRDRIIEKRSEIIKYRSLSIRNHKLSGKED